MKVSLTRWMAIFAFVAAGATAPADTFFPITSVSSSTAGTDYFPVANLIQGPGVGYDINEPHNRTSGLTWVTDAPNGGTGDYFNPFITLPVLVFDMGADRDLSEISVWGYSDGNANGAKDFSLRFATEAEGPAGFGTSIAYSPSFIAARPVTARQSFSFDRIVSARYVEMTLTDNYYQVDGSPGGDRTGLGEVAFEDRDIVFDPTLDAPTDASFFLAAGLPEEFNITLGNNGQQAVTVGAITFTGSQASAFSVQSAPTSIPFLGAESLVIRVDPTGQPSTMRATVHIASNDPTSPKLIDLVAKQPASFYPIDSATSTTAGTDFYNVFNLIQGPGVGFDAGAQHAQIAGGGDVMLWVTNAPNGGTGDYFAPVPDPAPVLVFDLGQDRLLGEISLWGYSAGNANGTKDFSLRFGTDAGGLEGIGSSITFTTGGVLPFGFTERHSFSLGRLLYARYVELTPVDNYYGSGLAPGGDRVGLGEVAFEQFQTVDPQLSSPLTVPFTTKGAPVSGTFEVSNIGATQTLTITSVIATGADAGLLQITSSPTSLAPGVTGQVAWTLTPGTQAGPVDASIVVASNDPLNPEVKIDLTGTVQNPAAVLPVTVSVGPLPAADGPQVIHIPIGNEGASNPLTLSNLALSGPHVANFAITTNPSPVAGASTANVELSFDRQGTDGIFRATLTGNTNDTLHPAFSIPIVVSVTINQPLVAWWPLDIDGTDASGNGHDGFPVGSPFQTTGANAATGGALEFDGFSRFDVPYSPDLNPQSFTVTLWAHPNVVGGNYGSPITSRDDYQGGVQTHGYILYSEPGGIWNFWTGDGNPGWSTLTGPTVVASEWVHFGLVYDALTNTKTLYVNGAVAATVAGGATQLYSPNGTTEQEMLHIGAGADDGNSFFFNGRIDDVGLFRVALSEADINSIRTDGVGGFINPVPPFKILSIDVPAAGSLRISFESTEGTTYQIQRSTTLARDDWQTIDTIGGAAGASTTYTDSNLPAGADEVFYRVRQLD